MIDLVFSFHQSFLGEYLLCPERARQKWHELVPDGGSDATAIGTGVHAAIEHVLRGGTAGDGWEKAKETFLDETQVPHYRWIQVKTEVTAFRYMETCFNSWLQRVYPHLGMPIWIEKDFDVHLEEIVLPDGRTAEIRLAGTIDYGDEFGLWDWKTCKDPTKYTPGWGGEGWKLKRFGIQPTVYTAAAAMLGFYDDMLGQHPAVPWSFTFAAMTKTTPGVTFLECERDDSHLRWLQQLTTNVAVMLASSLPEWPKNDQHALCSADWCPVWAAGRCKGVAVEVAA